MTYPLSVEAAHKLLDAYRLAVLERHEHGDPAEDEHSVRAAGLEVLDAMTGGVAGALMRPLPVDHALADQVAQAAAVTRSLPLLDDGGPDFSPFRPIAAALSNRFPKHGVGSLGHGAGDNCDALGGDDCNNGQCRHGRNHACTIVCTALVVWDTRTGGSWVPDAPNLRGADPGDLVILSDLILEGGPHE